MLPTRARLRSATVTKPGGGRSEQCRRVDSVHDAPVAGNQPVTRIAENGLGVGDPLGQGIGGSTAPSSTHAKFTAGRTS